MQQRNTAAARGLLVEQNSPIDDAKLNELINKSPIEDHYELERDCFARGKFAQVRRIRHRKTGQQFAAKTIKKRRPRHGIVTEEIHHEIRVLLLSEKCSGIVKLIEVFEASNEFYLVLELAQGGELQQILDDEQVIEEQVCRRIMRQIVEGLHFLHEHNVAHLDIKPQNILLTEPLPSGNVRLCDFGISRIVSDKLELREIMGTTDYMAPETLNYEPISLTTDIWSVGVVTYSLLSGLSPFGGDDRLHTYSNITSQEVDFPDDCFGHISAAAKDFISKCLNKDQRKRINCETALQHEWLIIDEPTVSQELSQQVEATDENKTDDSSAINIDLPLDCSTLVEMTSPEDESSKPEITIIISDLDLENDDKENQPQQQPSQPSASKFTSHKRFSSEIFASGENQKLVAVVSANGIDITSGKTETNIIKSHLSHSMNEQVSSSENSSALSGTNQNNSNAGDNSHETDDGNNSDSNNNNVTLLRDIPLRFLDREGPKLFSRGAKHESSPPLTPNKKFYLSVDDNFAEFVKHSNLFTMTPLTRTRSVSMERLSCSGSSSNGSSPTMGVSGPMFCDSSDERQSHIVCHSTTATARVSSTSMSSLACHVFHHHSTLEKSANSNCAKINSSQCSSSSESLSSASSTSLPNGERLDKNALLSHFASRTLASDCL